MKTEYTREELRKHLLEKSLNPSAVDNFINFLFGEKIMDNREHRNKGMTCDTCMWFAEKVPSTPAGEEIPKKGIGRCRKNGYPAVFPSDWCGDHKLDENKI